MFKKSMYTLVFIILLVSVAACSSLPITSLNFASSTLSQNTASSSSKVTIENKLGIGILKLEGTDLAVTADQASTLLPLWKAVKSLSASKTSSSVEMAALSQQIEESLTSDQVANIEQLSWTQTELTAMMAEYGVKASSTSTGSTATSSQAQQSGGAAVMNVGMPGGDMMGGDITGGAPAAQSSSQAQPTTKTVNNTSSLNSVFADPIITLLKERTSL